MCSRAAAAGLSPSRPLAQDGHDQSVQCVGGSGDQLQAAAVQCLPQPGTPPPPLGPVRDHRTNQFAGPSGPLDHRMPEYRRVSRRRVGGRGQGCEGVGFVEERLEAGGCQEGRARRQAASDARLGRGVETEATTG